MSANMATRTVNPATTSGPLALGVSRYAPVMLWASIGFGFLAMATYVWGAWILSDDFRPVPLGSDPVPGHVLMAVRIIEAICVLAGSLMVWKFIVAPWLRTRELSFDGMLMINFLLLWWLDPIDNYVTVSFFYNGYATNMGSWANFIPGWGSPNAENLPEPLLMMAGFYLSFWLLTVLFGCWMLNAMQQRFPQLHIGWRIGALFVALAIVNIVLENSIVRTGMIAYPGVVHALSIFPGEVYQWPLYEAAIFSFANTGFVLVRYFRDDKGQSFVERGLDRLQISKRRKKLLSFLAIAGFLQPMFLLGYFLPYNLFAMRADTAPAYPSYVRTMICGDGTQYACPSYDWVPIPQRGSRVFIGPQDERLPQEIRDRQGIAQTGDPYAAN